MVGPGRYTPVRKLTPAVHVDRTGTLIPASVSRNVGRAAQSSRVADVRYHRHEIPQNIDLNHTDDSGTLVAHQFGILVCHLHDNATTAIGSRGLVRNNREQTLYAAHNSILPQKSSGEIKAEAMILWQVRPVFVAKTRVGSRTRTGFTTRWERRRRRNDRLSVNRKQVQR